MFVYLREETPRREAERLARIAAEKEAEEVKHYTWTNYGQAVIIQVNGGGSSIEGDIQYDIIDSEDPSDPKGSIFEIYKADGDLTLAPTSDDALKFVDCTFESLSFERSGNNLLIHEGADATVTITNFFDSVAVDEIQCLTAGSSTYSIHSIVSEVFIDVTVSGEYTATLYRESYKGNGSVTGADYRDRIDIGSAVPQVTTLGADVVVSYETTEGTKSITIKGYAAAADKIDKIVAGDATYSIATELAGLVDSE